MSQESEDNSWVFDSLICFLNGPVWNAPLQNFIEDKSLIFEPTEKNEIEYKKIYDEFKNLVDLMLGSFMEDMGITTELFEDACMSGMYKKLPTHFQENLFEQIWAANDFEMFKRMMLQKNIELQLQALELIEQKYGITPQLFQPASSSSTSNVIATDRKQQSPDDDDDESSSSTSQLEKQVLVEVIQQHCENDDTDVQMPSDFHEEKHYLETEFKNNAKLASATPSSTLVNNTDSISTQQNVEVNDAEIRKRQAYLKGQRDKLVALKKQVRKKHLEIEIGQGETSKLRPRSAQVAEASINAVALNEQPQTLEHRKALAERLRTEVIRKKSR